MKTLDPAHASRIATAIDQVNRAIASGISPAADALMVLDARHVAELAGEFLGRDIRRVFFLSKKGERLRQFALVAATQNGECLSKPEALVVEAFAWNRMQERAPRRKRVAVPDQCTVCRT